MLVGASRSICLLCRQPLSDGFANPTHWSFARSGRPPAHPVVSWAPAAGHTRVPTRLREKPRLHAHHPTPHATFARHAFRARSRRPPRCLEPASLRAGDAEV